ncbi:HNH endonuclease [Streptomyces sp. H27-C3]|uniref:HNH endonuclease n=1 Tax=Streptomyces sp. H27-C3 TaxID=3046305 RepID=UPI0024B98159|nr:HNH endonuclease [Streptomyces sp. H27-C3]MDJ0461566.1 HNH endonuclease [Streptomyces sp. H27-C3]
MQTKYDLARTRIATGAWCVDTATGHVVGGRGAPVGYVMSTGYVHIAIKEQKRVRRLYAHRVIWESVHGPIPDTMQVNHINGVKSDNRIANLELVTPAGNARHAYDTGLSTPMRGSRNGNAKLTPQQVSEIRARHAAGELQRTLGKEYGVSRGQVSRIVLGRRWAVAPCCS